MATKDEARRGRRTTRRERSMVVGSLWDLGLVGIGGRGWRGRVWFGKFATGF